MKSTSLRARALVSILGAVLVVAAACAPSAAPPAPTTSNSVSVTQVPSGDSGPCVPTSSAISSGTMTRTYASSPIEFVLTVDVANPLCSPINAAAVIYSCLLNTSDAADELHRVNLNDSLPLVKQ